MSAAAIAELEKLVARWQPDFASKIEGAPAELIDRLEARLSKGLSSPIKLAPEHRAFLERMGEDSDGLNAYGDDNVDLRASALLEFLDDPDLNDPQYPIDPRKFVIAGAPHDLLVPPLMFDRRQGVEPAPLVRLTFEEDGTPIGLPEHTSFMAMLFTWAFITKCLKRFAWAQELESPGTVRPQFPNSPPGRWLPHFRAIVGQLGFSPVADTGAWCSCVERADAAVMMYECPGYSPDVRVGAHDRIVFGNLVEQLCDNLQLRTRPASLRRPS